MRILLFILAILIVGALLYVRFAPLQAEKYHQMPKSLPFSGKPNEFGFVGADAYRFAGAPADVVARFHEFVMGEPRVALIAGRPEDGLMTYVARTKWIGFPDYVTVKIERMDDVSSSFEIYSRSRFGHSDLGVNEKRVQDWMKRFSTLVQEGAKL